MRKILYCCCTFLLSGASADAIEIRMKEEAVCAGSLVRLGDVAEIQQEAAATGEPFADLALFPAPPAGRTRQLRRQEVQEILALCDVDLRDCQFTGAETVAVRTAATEQRVLIRPALHLIPSRAYIRKVSTKPEAKAAAEAKPKVPAKLVHRNAAVTIHSLTPGVRVTTHGKSLADGALGEPVSVEQTGSRERVLARVVGPDVVEVHSEAK